ncbi:unnamed protein product [Prorocentrum cordatum]|uniref:Uncharacterized protein n=1 Tax=Prorocentrum cordatum TaxID=2364126 RepID=A0ABN9SI13_9DINO|nr:unnamed protein product [Polarella glacialis]
MAGSSRALAMTDATQFAEADKTLSMGSRTAHQLYLEDHLTRLSEDISSTTKRLELEKRRLNKLEQDVERTRLEHQEKVLRLPPKGVKKDDKEKAKKEQKVESVRTLEHRKMQAVAQLDDLGEAERPADPGPHRLHAPREDADESDLQGAVEEDGKEAGGEEDVEGGWPCRRSWAGSKDRAAELIGDGVRSSRPICSSSS